MNSPNTDDNEQTSSSDLRDRIWGYFCAMYHTGYPLNSEEFDDVRDSLNELFSRAKGGSK